MGLHMVLTSPETLAEQDPEYFALMVKIMRGEIK